MFAYLKRLDAAKICALYAMISIAWIAGSDQLVALVAGPETQTFLQTVKGTGFVLVTAIGLFLMIRLHDSQLVGSRSEASRQMRRVFEESPCAILLTEPETLKIVSANAASAEVLGQDHTNLPGSSLSDLLVPASSTQGSAALAGADTTQLLRDGPTFWAARDDLGQEILLDAWATLVQIDGRALLHVTLENVTDQSVYARVVADVARGVADRMSGKFHESLLLSLTRALGVDGGLVALIEDPEGAEIRTTGLVMDGEVADSITLRCDQCLAIDALRHPGTVIVSEDGVGGVLPKFSDGRPVKAMAAIGLADSRGEPLGVLAVMARTSLGNRGLVGEILKLAASPTSSELERISKEAALAASEAKFRDFALIASDWLWEQDEDFRFTSVCAGGSDTGSMAPAYVIGKTRWEAALANPDDDPDWALHRATLEAHLPFSDFTYSLDLPDGSVGYYRTNGKPVHDAEGRFVGYRGTAIDETAIISARNEAAQSRSRLADAIESLDSGFGLYDADDKLVVCNKRFIDRGGDFDIGDDIVGKSFEEVMRRCRQAGKLHPSMGDEDAWYEERARLHRELPSYHEVQYASGVWAEVREFRTAEGGTVTLWSNQSRRKKAEIELRNSEDRFRRMIAEASQGIVVHRDMKPLYCNPAFARMFGFDGVDEVLALDSIIELFGVEERDRLAGYTMVRQQGGHAPAEYEFAGRRKDGSSFPVANRVVRVTWDGEYAICANMFDISEQAATKEALARSEREFRDLVEGSVQGVLIHTAGRLRFANQAAATLFGYDTPEALIEQGCLAGLLRAHGADDDTVSRADAELSALTELQCTRRDGSALNLELLVRDVDWQGEASAQITMMDVTASKQAQDVMRRSQRMEAIGQLSGGVAHDFNNLLGVIMGNLEFLKRMIGDNDAAAARVESALKATNRGSGLTRRLLAFASQDAQEGTPTDVNVVLGGLEDILTRTLTSEVAFELHPARGLWLTDIDPGDLEDAVLNLALNARDAMPNGGRLVVETDNVTVRAEPAASKPRGGLVAPGEYVVVSVSDSGHGIPTEVLERVFEPFFSTKPAERGTGLGLSIVYGFVRRSRGDVRIHSEVGQGTTVRLFLPRSDAQASELGEEDNRVAAPQGGCETVLVVDDEPDLLELAEFMLNDLGYRTLTARSGVEALTMLEDSDGRPVDLVFTDVIMSGGVNGVELAERVAKSHPAMRILLASGFTGRLHGTVLESKLGRSMLHKPYSKADLAAAVRGALDDHSPSSGMRANGRETAEARRMQGAVLS